MMELSITALTRQIAIHPDKPELYAMRALAYHQRGEIQLALNDLDTAEALEPGLEDAAFTRAFVHYDLDQYDQAIDTITNLIDRTPGNPESHYFRGISAFYRDGEGDDQRAREDFEIALSLSPNDPKVHHGMGLLLLRQDRKTEALEHASIAITRATEFCAQQDYFLLRGRCRVLLGEVNLGIEDYRKATIMDPFMVSAHENLAYAETLNGEYTSALSSIEMALRMEPSATRYILRATIHKHIGNMKNALSDLEEAIALEPSLELPYLQAADLHRTAGLNSIAIAVYRRMARNTGMKNLARVRIARVMYECGNTKGAINMLTSAIDQKKAEGRDDAHYIMGVIYENEGDVVNALHQYSLSIHTNPEHYSALSARGELRIKLGEMNQGREDITMARNIVANHPGGPAVLRYEGFM